MSYTKAQAIAIINDLPDDARLCPYCLEEMGELGGDEGETVYMCRNEMCLYEEEEKA